ncbi:MAG: response regulator [Planctomycetes bacterium]|nr:response regulator [Planctomycetota bacterium]
MSRGTLLVVDENSISRRMIRAALRAEGYDVLEAADGRSALRVSKETPPDLVLLDLSLPDMSSDAVAEQLRREFAGREVPILGVAAAAPGSRGTLGGLVGFTEVIRKPIEPSHLLPIVAAVLARGQRKRAGPGAGKRVLVVDDDPALRKLHRLQLEALGFLVESAEDGRKALEAVRTRPPDILVSDVLMPSLDGFSLCLALRADARLARLPVVLVSSIYVGEEDRRMARAVGATDLVVPIGRPNAVPDAVLRACSATPSPAASQPPGIPPLYASPVPGPAHARHLERLTALYLNQARRLALLEAGFRLVVGLAETLDENSTISALLEDGVPRCLNAAGLSRGAALLPDGPERFRLAAHCGYAPDDLSSLERLFGCVELLHQVVRTREPLLLRGEAGEPAAAATLLERTRSRSLLLAPISAGHDTPGVLLLALEASDMDRDWISIARALGSQLGLMIAITRAVASLATRERQNESILNSAAEGICGVDETGRLTFANPAASRMTGYAVRELLGQELRRLLLHTRPAGEPGEGETGGPTAALHPDAGRQVAEGVFWRKDGGSFPVEYTTMPIREGARCTGMVVTFRDVTERRRAQAAILESHRRLEQALQDLRRTQDQLVQQERLRALGQMATGIAHDLNNALVPILGCSELLLSASAPANDPSFVREQVGLIHAGAEIATGVVRRLCLFARGSDSASRVPVDLPLLVQQVVELTRPRWRNEAMGEGRTIGIETRLEPTPPVLASPTGLKESMVNLVFNALEAMPAGGILTLATRAEQDQVVVEVSDTGTGMPEEVRRRCFEPFFTTKGVKGTGLGLAMVYGIVRQEGGSIEVTSQVGQGTRFVLRFPALPTPPTPPPPAETPKAGVPPLRILLVEDEELVRSLMSSILELDAHDVQLAVDGQDGLAKFKEGTFDLVITDRAMPRLRGDQLAEEIKRLSPKTPILMVSGFGDLMATQGEKPAGVDAVLGKPVRIEALRDAIREVVTRTR